jgi:hypothetical protein
MAKTQGGQSQAFRNAQKCQMIIGSDRGGPVRVRARLDVMVAKLEAAGGDVPESVTEYYQRDDARLREIGAAVPEPPQAPEPPEITDSD